MPSIVEVPGADSSKKMIWIWRAIKPKQPRDAIGTERFPSDEETQGQGTLGATAIRKALLRKHKVRGAVSCTVDQKAHFSPQKTELIELWTSGTVRCIDTPLKEGFHPTLKKLLYI